MFRVSIFLCVGTRGGITNLATYLLLSHLSFGVPLPCFKLPVVSKKEGGFVTFRAFPRFNPTPFFFPGPPRQKDPQSLAASFSTPPFKGYFELERIESNMSYLLMAVRGCSLRSLLDEYKKPATRPPCLLSMWHPSCWIRTTSCEAGFPVVVCILFFPRQSFSHSAVLTLENGSTCTSSRKVLLSL